MFIIFIIFTFIAKLHGADQGCSIGGLQGTCQPISACSGVFSLLKDTDINFCQEEDPELYICCPDYLSSPTVEVEQYEDPSSISVKKCEEYYPPPADFIISAVGGTKSLPKEFPHMALIGYGQEKDKQWLCGGSLISHNFVLTAAHCLQSTDYGEAKWVHLGDLDISTDEDDAEPQDFKIIRVIAHPRYSFSSKYHDIALVKLDRNVMLTEYVAIACLQTVKKIYDPYNNMTAAGWGKIGFAEEQSSFLLKVSLNEVNTETCNRLYSDVKKSILPQGIVGNTMICAGGEIGVDTCEGDSGGPLQVRNHYKYDNGKGFRIVGVTSFGKACGITRSPSIYTRVSYYTNWIESIVWPEEYKKAHS
ncbi:venom protease [Diabrotica virgifera virgifera]|uniref:Venom protease-like isoform X1 n=1 Tax=Diabrotica virgifera virgifera TaxID=50390 RepID=A0A6P7FH27_DIAVI|nr:venom protease [Diabrotica virgifera virgifera]